MKEEHSMKVVSCLNDYFERHQQPLQVDLLRGLPPIVLLLRDDANLHDELLQDIKRLIQECLDPDTLRELGIDVNLPDFFVTRAPLHSAHHYLVTFIED